MPGLTRELGRVQLRLTGATLRTRGFVAMSRACGFVSFCIVLYRLYRRGPNEAPKIRTPPNVGGLRSLPAQIRFWAWKQPASDRDELRVVFRQARQVGDARVGGLERETLSVGMGFRRPPSATPEAPPIRSIGYPCNINLAKPVVATGRSAESRVGCSIFGQSSRDFWPVWRRSV